MAMDSSCRGTTGNQFWGPHPGFAARAAAGEGACWGGKPTRQGPPGRLALPALWRVFVLRGAVFRLAHRSSTLFLANPGPRREVAEATHPPISQLFSFEGLRK